jgi:hypothetical protein
MTKPIFFLMTVISSLDVLGTVCHRLHWRVQKKKGQIYFCSVRWRDQQGRNRLRRLPIAMANPGGRSCNPALMLRLLPLIFSTSSVVFSLLSIAVL